ncbi:MAG: hypothetical protein KJP09_02430 [Bacteroidia bacterium]|nr:hypothetical protein [Bacteroidia bacterium]
MNKHVFIYLLLTVFTSFSSIFSQLCDGVTYSPPSIPANCTYNYTSLGWFDSAGNPISKPNGTNGSESICFLADNAESFGGLNGLFYLAPGVNFTGSINGFGGGDIVIDGNLSPTNNQGISNTNLWVGENGTYNRPGNMAMNNVSNFYNAGTINIGGTVSMGGDTSLTNFPNSTYTVGSDFGSNGTVKNCGLMLAETGEMSFQGGSDFKNFCAVYAKEDMQFNNNFTNDGLFIIDGSLTFGGGAVNLFNRGTMLVTDFTLGDGKNFIGDNYESILIVRNNAALTSGASITDHLFFDVDDGGGFDSVCGSCTEDVLLINTVDIPATEAGLTENCGAGIIVGVPSATIDFDGIDDYIDSSLNLSGYAAMTAMAWIKLDPAFTNTGNVLDQGAFDLQITNTFRPRVQLNSGLATAPFANALPLDVWTHLAVVYDGSLASDNLKLYINGEHVATSSDPSLLGSINASGGRFTIGREASIPAEFFHGAIDEVRMFDVALTEEQLRRSIYQEIEQKSTKVAGSVIPYDIDKDLPETLLWTNLQAYYPMKEVKTNSRTTDYSSYDRLATLYNIATVQPQTAPMPYETQADGSWTTLATWLNGDVQDITDLANLKDWSIVRVAHDLNTVNSHTQLGMIIDDTKTLSVIGDQEINNSWYLELNGTIDLAADSQLVQQDNSELVTDANGNILRRQEGTNNIYRYNYWSSPVGALIAGGSNSAFSLDQLKDTNGTISFTTAMDPPMTTPSTLSTAWTYSFQNGVTYYDWSAISESSSLLPGTGYIHKGTGTASPQQQYIFDGRPNNGTITIPVMDVGGPGSVPSLTATNYLLGNPYASALDVVKFIEDNETVIGGTLYLWEQWDGDSHEIGQYQAGYATVNKVAGVRAFQFQGLQGGNSGSQDGLKTPTLFLPVGQAFVTEIVTNGNVEFNNTQRIFKKEATNETVFFRSEENRITQENSRTAENQILRFNFDTSNGLSREFVVAFSQEATDEYDPGYDSRIFELQDNDMVSLLNEDNLIIQTLSPLNENKVVDLIYVSTGAYTHKLELTAVEGSILPYEVFLIDNLTGSVINLNQQAYYEFTSDSGEFTNRFQLSFEDPTLGIDDLFNAKDLLAFFRNDLLMVKGLNQGEYLENLQIVNIRDGRQYMDIDFDSTLDPSNGIPVHELESGFYIVKLRSSQREVTKKLLKE